MDGTPTLRAPRIGDVIEHHRLEELLSTTPSTQVFRATSVALKREVAFKVLRPEAAADEPQLRERFRREALALARLDHPGIIRIYSAGEVDGVPFAVTQLITGETLSERLARGPLAPAEATELLRPIAEALDLAHTADVVHRDVRPENIVLRPGHGAVLAEFASARPTNTPGLTTPGTLIGSLQYVSPEQIKGDSATARSDVFSFTALLWTCVVGRPPWDAGGAQQVLVTRLQHQVPTLTTADGAPAARVAAVLAAGLAEDPAARTPRATAVLDGFAAALRDLDPTLALTAPGFRARSEGSEEQQAAIAGMTVVDRQRAPEASVLPVDAGGRKPSGRQLAIAGASLVVLPLLAFFTGRELRPSGPAPVTAALLTVEVPNGWKVERPSPPPGVKLQGARGLRTPDGVRVVLGRLTATGPAGDPLVGLTGVEGPEPALRQAGKAPVTTYDLGAGSLAVLATNRGSILASCAGRDAVAAQRTCTSLLAQAKLRTGVRTLTPKPDQATADAITSALAEVRNGRGTLKATIASKGDVASALENVGRLSDDAAADLRDLRGRDAGAVAGLAAALREQASDLAELADAYDRENAAGYRSAKVAAEEQESGVRDALRALMRAGYTVEDGS